MRLQMKTSFLHLGGVIMKRRRCNSSFIDVDRYKYFLNVKGKGKYEKTMQLKSRAPAELWQVPA